jgi:trans-2-enoyl-CoA reductase
VRQGPQTENIVNNLKNLGADLVCTHDYVRTPHFKDTIKELKKPKVAFNCVGGDSATELARHLADGGIMVTYPSPSLVCLSSFLKFLFLFLF